NPTRGWYSTTPYWVDWVRRLEQALKPKWHRLRIYEAIKLSTKQYSFDNGSMASHICFLNPTNFFAFPFGMLGITMEIRGASCASQGGISSCSSLSIFWPWSLFGQIVTKTSTKTSPRVYPNEEISFYLFFICKFLVCNSSTHVYKTFLNMTYSFNHGLGPLKLSPFFLGQVYTSLNETLEKDFQEKVMGPLWLV
ncbi:LOW QUALITY PROTEIN: hypothetical protein CFOL_v3_02417, partial [Cephalotus follicularis]